MNFLAHAFQSHQLVGLMPQPRLQVRAEPIIGGNDMKNLPYRQFLKGLGGLADRHGADKAVAIKRYNFQTDFIRSASGPAEALTWAAIFLAISLKACAGTESGCVRTTG